MEWTEDLSVGIDLIDRQHQELFARINDLVAAVRQHTCKHKIGDVIQFLDDYIVFHFTEEERYMRMNSYPDYEIHKAQHEEFIRSFARLKRKLPRLEGGTKPGSYDLSVETNKVVVDWILAHISELDKKFGTFVKEGEKA